MHCLVVGITAPLTLFVGDNAGVTTRSALIPPRLPLRVVAEPDARALFCYVDATRTRAGELSNRMTGRAGALETDHDAEDVLIALDNGARCSGAEIMKIVAGESSTSIDGRILRVTEELRRHPADSPSADRFARLEGMSRSYFLRLFAAETGTSFRQYRLWMRMLHAARSVSAGADLTRAAADAGFASPSHFSDVFLRMFGMTATTLTALAGTPIVLDRHSRSAAPGRGAAAEEKPVG